MLENLKHIKNPLTLISIFAGAAELGGAAVLPFISENNQASYINFLIFFPIYTVTLFFATLNFNHRTLYAPSDYKDENHFMTQLGQATSEEVSRKLSDETEEVQAGTEEYQASHQTAAQRVPSGPAEPVEGVDTAGSDSCSLSDQEPDVPTIPLPPNPEPERNKASSTITQDEKNRNKYSESINKKLNSSQNSELPKDRIDIADPDGGLHRSLMANVALIEKLAIKKLSNSLGIDFIEDVRFSPHNLTMTHVFDAADYSDGKHLQLLEVKLFKRGFDPKRFLKTLESTQILHLSFGSKRPITLHLVAVVEHTDLTPALMRSRLKNITIHYDYAVILHIIDLKNLHSPGGRFY
jgi:hypothetical protein